MGLCIGEKKKKELQNTETRKIDCTMLSLCRGSTAAAACLWPRGRVLGSGSGLVRAYSTAQPAAPVTIAGLLTSGSKRARSANRARETAARIAAMLRSPGAAVSSVALANVALYGVWKTAFWCASSMNPTRSAFGLCFVFISVSISFSCEHLRGCA